MATVFHVELVTPERVLFSGEAEAVTLRSEGGEIAFLARHEDFIGAVEITVVHIDLGSAESRTDSARADDGFGEVRAAVHGGFVNVDKDGVVILAGVGELAGEIDVERAHRALATASERSSRHESDASSTGVRDDGSAEGSISTSAIQALLYPESPEVAARRAQARLEAAGALTTA